MSTTTTPAAPAKKTAAKKPAVKKAAPVATKKASKAPAKGITLHIEQFRKEVGKKVSLIVAKVINRTDCFSFQYDNQPFVIFAKEGSEESAVQKVVQTYNAGQ